MESQTMQSVEDFIKKHQIKMVATRLPARTDRAANNWDKDAFHYLVTITCGDRPDVHSFPFSMGAGHVEKIPLKELRAKGRMILENAYNRCPPPHQRGVSIFYDELRKIIFRPKPPELADVLDCVASDCAGISNARCFEDWASEHGYDTDSRKAEATYDSCVREFREFERLFGRRVLAELMFETERR